MEGNAVALGARNNLPYRQREGQKEIEKDLKFVRPLDSLPFLSFPLV